MSEPNVKGRWESFLPDEIAISIFTRVELKDVLRCRCVAKRWRDVTSTPYFVDLHHKQHGMAHMILVDKPKGKGDCRDRFFLDEWWITDRKKPLVHKIHGHPLYQSVFSQDGLLVLQSGCVCCDQIVIVNPIFREKVRILVSTEWRFWIGMIYGVYFNPTLKEYCLLFDASLKSSVPWKSSIPKPPVTYKMLTLGSNPCLRDIRNPYKDRYPYGSLDLGVKRPAKVDCFLYWLVDVEGPDDEYPSCYYPDIMEFDTRTHSFKLMRCPAPMTDYGRFGLDLLNIDGFLSLVQIVAHQGAVEVNTWTLKDRASESWNFSQYDLDYKVYPPESGWWHFQTIAVRCGEILIRSEQKLYVCNLEWGAAKVLGRRTYPNFSTFLSHDICISSLKNCKPVIHIGNIKRCQNCIKLEKKWVPTSSSSTANEHSDVVEEIAICDSDEGAGCSAS